MVSAIVDSIASKVDNNLPEGRVKQSLRRLYRYREIRNTVGALDIVDSGVDEDYPWVEFDNGLRFYGFETPESDMWKYNCLPPQVQEKLVPEAYLVAFDYYRSYAETDFDRERGYDIKSGDTIVEVGPYHGYKTVMYSDRVGEQGEVISIEAHPDNFDILCKNVAANDLDNVIPVERAVSDSNDTLEFYETNRATGKDNSLREDNFERYEDQEVTPIEVESETLDDILDKYDVEDVDHVVVTVNLAELEVLRGMESTLEDGVELACVASADRSKLVTLLEDYGYDVRISEEFFEPIIYASPGE